MRVQFAIGFTSSSLDESQATARTLIADYLKVSVDDVASMVDIELKVCSPDSENEDAVKQGLFEVTAFGTLKHSVLRPGS